MNTGNYHLIKELYYMAKKKPETNAFDVFATAKSPAKKSASAKIAADMTPKVQTAVDTVIKNKATIKKI